MSQAVLLSSILDRKNSEPLLPSLWHCAILLVKGYNGQSFRAILIVQIRRRWKIANGIDAIIAATQKGRSAGINQRKLSSSDLHYPTIVHLRYC